MADETRHLLVNRLNGLPVLDGLSDIEYRARHRARDEDTGVSQVHPGADTATETEADGTRVLLCRATALLSQETFRVEGLWVAVDARVMKHALDVGENQGAGRNEVSVLDIILDYAMGNTARRDRIPAQHLLRKGIDVRELFAITKRGETVISNDAIDFSLCLLENLRVTSKNNEEGIDSRDGLRTCKQVDYYHELKCLQYRRLQYREMLPTT